MNPEQILQELEGWLKIQYRVGVENVAPMEELKILNSVQEKINQLRAKPQYESNPCVTIKLEKSPQSYNSDNAYIVAIKDEMPFHDRVILQLYNEINERAKPATGIPQEKNQILEPYPIKPE